MQSEDEGQRGFYYLNASLSVQMVFRIRLVAVQLLVAFAIAQIVGLWVGAQFAAQGLSAVENPSDPANAVYFLGGILVTTTLMLVLLKFYKGRLLFVGLEAVLMFVAGNLFFSLFFDGMVALGLSLALLALRFLFEPARQYVLLLSTVVVGGLLGASLDLIPVTLFVVLLAGYDFVAVFMTKHMVTLAKRLDERKTNFTVGFKQKKQQVQLGTGDFVVPIVFGVSVLNALGIGPAIAAALGATAGLGALLWHMERQRGYFPGLPPIVGGQLLAVGVAAGLKMLFGA